MGKEHVADLANYPATAKMNPLCTRFSVFTMTRCLLTCALTGLLSIASAAHAARNFPPDVKSGQFKAFNYVQAQIDDQVYRAAPGLRVFDTHNRIVFAQTVPADTAVLYQLDIRGDLIQMWVALPDEMPKTGMGEYGSTW